MLACKGFVDQVFLALALDRCNYDLELLWYVGLSYIFSQENENVLKKRGGLLTRA
jgi:hypothetical protein